MLLYKKIVPHDFRYDPRVMNTFMDHEIGYDAGHGLILGKTVGFQRSVFYGVG